MIQFYPWPDTQNPHNLRKYLVQSPEVLGSNQTVTYKGKIKLDGTNSCIQVHPDGAVVVQSRTRIITPQDDNMGFAKFVHSELEYWQSLARTDGKILLIYGEWAGKGINKDMAICNIPCKIFAVFALKLLEPEQDLVKAKLIVEPFEIFQILGRDDYFGCISDSEFAATEGQICPFIYVLPWHSSKAVSISWLGLSEEVQKELDPINSLIKEIVECDPWVKKTFGYDKLEGPGEGLVYYPVSHSKREDFVNLAFKAKGDKSQTSKTAKPAQAEPENIVSVADFVKLTLTVARMEQGVRSVNSGQLVFHVSKLGPFLGWIGKDIQKECGAELASANLSWKDVSKVITDEAKKWFLAEDAKL